MSVFIRRDAKDGVYSYDFRIQGRRFSGSTERTSRREAERVEKQKKQEARAQIAAEKAFTAPEMPFVVAASRWWLEVGQHHRNADTTLWSLDWLKSAIGPSTMLHAIDDSTVARLVAKRRGEFVPSQRKPGRKYRTPEMRKRVSSATVNRTVTQPLREIVTRAAKVWKVRTAEIAWSRHLLPEPQERVREASPAEEAAILSQLSEGYAEAVEFAFLTGCRRMEILGLSWTDVDFFGRRFTVTGKGGKKRTIPMSQRVFELLWAEQGRHAEKVFTYVAERTVRMKDGRLLCRGQRYPLTEAGLKTAMRRAVPRAGVADFRFHDTRHTAATRVLRASNLRVAQKLLGHADIATTTKYAHALDDDVREAMEIAGRKTEREMDERLQTK